VPGRTTLILGLSLVVVIAAAGAVIAVTAAGRNARDHAKADAAQAKPAPAAVAVSPASRSVVSPPASPSGPPKQTDPFTAAAASYLGGREGVVSAAVYDLSTGQLWTIGPGRPQAEASIVKVDILETLLMQAGTGGVLSGGDAELAQSMIEDSDNDSATDLWDAVGGVSGIHSFNDAAGLTDTTPSPCVECADFPWPGWGLSTTTPADQITLLRQIAGPGGLLTSAQRGYAAGLMENITPSQRWGVCADVPAQVTVALKSGWLPLNQAGTDWQINSVGWISGLGRDYLIAVLSTGNPAEQYGIDTIDQLSASVWRHLG
jgi:beta-lactamase class A